MSYHKIALSLMSAVIIIAVVTHHMPKLSIGTQIAVGAAPLYFGCRGALRCIRELIEIRRTHV